ncbi:MAG: DUF1707 domain-containing protein [Acidimicrobiales bacterium]|jgi:hypothetical protein
MDESSYRVSDAEREKAVVVLRDHLLEGRLTLEEFSERAGLALRSQVIGDLTTIQQDLPPLSTVGAPTSHRKPTRLTLAVFGHVVRRGRIRLRRRTTAASVLADIDLDLREASIENRRTSVSVLAFLGNVDVYVPEGIDVDVGGLTIFGHRRDWGRDVAAPNAPTVHIRTLGLFGTVDVWRVPSDVSGDYGSIIDEVRTRHRAVDRKREPGPSELPRNS